MLRRIAWILVAFPAAVLLITLAIANRHNVQLVLDPFRPEMPALSLVLPFYAYLFAALVAGVVLGGFATWVTQRHWRRSARVGAHEAKRWHAEADRLAREREAQASREVLAAREALATRGGQGGGSKQLVAAGH